MKVDVKKAIQIGSAIISGVIAIASQIEDMHLKETVKELTKKVADLEKR